MPLAAEIHSCSKPTGGPNGAYKRQTRVGDYSRVKVEGLLIGGGLGEAITFRVAGMPFRPGLTWIMIMVTRRW